MGGVLLRAGLFVAGALAGGSAVYILAKKRFEERLKNEVDGVRALYRARYSASQESAEKDENKITVNLADPETIELTGEILYAPVGEDPLVLFNGEPLVVDDGDRPDDERIYDGIYPISPEMYREGRPGQATVELLYYAVDGVVTDDQGIPIEDIDRFLGDFETRFGSEGASSDELYVRNMRESWDFHVVKLNESYEERVIGRAPERKGDPRGAPEE